MVEEDFADEKAAILEAETPKDKDVTMPGWGSWGGIGVQPAKRQRRFIEKAPVGPPRKDQHLKKVIINERLVGGGV